MCGHWDRANNYINKPQQWRILINWCTNPHVDMCFEELRSAQYLIRHVLIIILKNPILHNIKVCFIALQIRLTVIRHTNHRSLLMAFTDRNVSKWLCSKNNPWKCPLPVASCQYTAEHPRPAVLIKFEQQKEPYTVTATVPASSSGCLIKHSQQEVYFLCYWTPVMKIK